MAKYEMITQFRQFGKNTSSWKPMCSAIVFKNAGGQRATINDNLVLEPGDETPTISTGHPDVVDVTNYSVVFDATTGTGPLVIATYTQIKPAKATAGPGNCEKF